MAKKISKHSRAARRGEIDVSATNENRDLENIPRLHKTDTISPMIRASAEKNQQLLSQRLQKKKSKTGRVGKNEGLSKVRQKRGSILSDKLSSKIDASIARANMIKFTRKNSWEQTNKLTKLELLKTKMKNKIALNEKRKLEQEKQNHGQMAQDDDEFDMDLEEKNEEVPTLVSKQNAFELLGEDVEA
ncbi:unnamed protein product [Ambrosiozyma monospora]|uniref:Unnamed protein product n=1 Tax=Ambrosiozyma monospora TaxID=43982 RepID=A0A9W7DMG7_AMBMO|nr:unnamed protein product [Ambrosiozyma monospora]